MKISKLKHRAVRAMKIIKIIMESNLLIKVKMVKNKKKRKNSKSQISRE